MATLENGYTRVANELLKMIYSTNFTATEFKILLFIIRFTYGYGKKSTDLSLTYISKGIGVSKRYVSSSLSKLIEDKVVIVVREHTDTQSRIIGINNHCEQWENRNTVQQVKQSSTGEVKRNTTDEAEFNPTGEAEFNQEKKTLNKTLNKSDSDFPDEEQLKSDFEKIYSIYPKKTTKATAFSNYKKWLKGKQVDGKKIKLNNKQIYIAVYRYVKQQEDIGAELKFYKNFSTLMGNQLLDFVPSDEEMQRYEN